MNPNLEEYCFLNPNRCFEHKKLTFILHPDLSLTITSYSLEWHCNNITTYDYITYITGRSIFPIDNKLISLQNTYVIEFCKQNQKQQNQKQDQDQWRLRPLLSSRKELKNNSHHHHHHNHNHNHNI